LREFLFAEAEGRGWHSVRMRRRNQAGTGHDNLLFVRWRDGFEELDDHADDPNLLRERLQAMRIAAGDQYRALETG